ncbi:hypothetical protein [Epibacterium ulvae]|uniref:hypothetical protein n=1 Tax=Epibacterium ulvae TaxID=1156985 RepID=UPI0024911FB1|nr:hypothetical protein [Epibacterium ulvae]
MNRRDLMAGGLVAAIAGAYAAGAEASIKAQIEQKVAELRDLLDKTKPDSEVVFTIRPDSWDAIAPRSGGILNPATAEWF